MALAQIELTAQAIQALHDIARRTGKSQDELVREAVDQLISQYEARDRHGLLQRARGIWKDRTDLPDFDALKPWHMWIV